jgi:hypothetical protein
MHLKLFEWLQGQPTIKLQEISRNLNNLRVQQLRPTRCNALDSGDGIRWKHGHGQQSEIAPFQLPGRNH